jgi:hypothetical protein
LEPNNSSNANAVQKSHNPPITSTITIIMTISSPPTITTGFTTTQVSVAQVLAVAGITEDIINSSGSRQYEPRRASV